METKTIYIIYCPAHDLETIAFDTRAEAEYHCRQVEYFDYAQIVEIRERAVMVPSNQEQ